MKLERTTTFILLAVIIFVIIYGLQHYGPRTRFGPVVIGTAGAILALIQIVRENFIKDSALQKGQVLQEKEKAAIGPAIGPKLSFSLFFEIVAWLGGLLLAMYLLGLILAYAVFLIIYLKFYGERWPMSIALTAAMLGLIYGVFHKSLGLYLYKGILLD